jgi:hypothetical protein
MIDEDAVHLRPPCGSAQSEKLVSRPVVFPRARHLSEKSLPFSDHVIMWPDLFGASGEAISETG